MAAGLARETNRAPEPRPRSGDHSARAVPVVLAAPLGQYRHMQGRCPGWLLNRGRCNRSALFFLHSHSLKYRSMAGVVLARARETREAGSHWCPFVQFLPCLMITSTAGYVCRRRLTVKLTPPEPSRANTRRRAGSVNRCESWRTAGQVVRRFMPGGTATWCWTPPPI